MKVTTESVVAQVSRKFTIDADHPVVPMAYAMTPKQFRITQGSITYRYQDGAWVVKDHYSVTLTGPVLKQDGGDSKNHHRRPPRATRAAGVDLVEKLTEEYQWLVPIINLLRPTGELMMMGLDDAEVNG